jgi:D-beta-D-heptose 7-phosphate kinase/D-beta-D-heptose 1-phosphate adenosyltransferase
MNSTQLRKLLRSFPDQTILVVGDAMLDQFLWGKVSRISPEAPVPVVEITRESFFPGGAANVARNLRALDGRVKIVSVIGADDTGTRLRQILDEEGVDTTGLVVDFDRPTTLKTRIVACHQQVVRFDRETTQSLRPGIAGKLIEFFETGLTGSVAVIFADYGKGVLSQRAFNTMQRLARRHRKITAADPAPRRMLRYHGLTVVTPNRLEAFAAAGIPYAEPAGNVLDDSPLMQAGRLLLRKWKPRNLLVTLGEHGMCLFRAGQKPRHIPTVAREVFDVSGAGDTVIATMTLALAAGADAVDAADLSNHAAGIVVGKIGTATCFPDELAKSYANNQRHPA